MTSFRSPFSYVRIDAIELMFEFVFNSMLLAWLGEARDNLPN